MFDPNEITKTLVQDLINHIQWRTGALLWFVVPDLVAASQQPHPLEQSPVREYVETLCRVVNDPPAWDKALASEVMDITQALAEGLCISASGGYEIPATFWLSDVGRLIVAAQLWARGDELITLSDAARLLRGSAEDRDLVYVNALIKAGKLIAYTDESEPNPQRARRVSRAAVEALRDV